VVRKTKKETRQIREMRNSHNTYLEKSVLEISFEKYKLIWEDNA